jgi:hypothetical protein
MRSSSTRRVTLTISPVQKIGQAKLSGDLALNDMDKVPSGRLQLAFDQRTNPNSRDARTLILNPLPMIPVFLIH